LYASASDADATGVTNGLFRPGTKTTERKGKSATGGSYTTKNELSAFHAIPSLGRAPLKTQTTIVSCLFDQIREIQTEAIDPKSQGNRAAQMQRKPFEQPPSTSLQVYTLVARLGLV
jgi:hypothetical protein